VHGAEPPPEACNREEALERLVERRPTRPIKASRERRMEGKNRRSGIKALRQGKPSAE
jgi:ribosome-associated protein